MPIKLSNDFVLWLRRLALYSSFGAAIIIASHLVFSYFGFLHTDVDSARYMLSALVQGEAAIVALVVTLSLVAVQLAAQSYSARVIEVFRRTPDLWILMGIYGVAIFYGLGVLKMIENPLVGRLSNLEAQVSFAYYLGVFAFAAPVPYIWNTLDLLKPSTVIDMLSRRITKQNILDAIGEGEEKSYENDPIQPIIDIVRGSLMKYDYETVRDGLRVIGDRVKDIAKEEPFKEEDENILKHIFFHLMRVGILATNREDDHSTFQVIISMVAVEDLAVKQKLRDAIEQALISYRVVGEAAAQKKLEGSTTAAVYRIRCLGIFAAGQKFGKMAEMAAGFLVDVGIVASEYKLKDAPKWITKYLKNILEVAEEQGLPEVSHIEESFKKLNEALSKSEK